MLLYILTAGTLLTGTGYLAALYSNHQRWKYLLKPGTMLWIILIAITYLPQAGGWGWWVLVGLLFSIAGDIFLMLPNRFMQGLVAFFLAHLCYITAFPFSWHLGQALGITAILLLLSLWFFYRLLPHLRHSNEKKLPIAVLLYILVISIMLWKAVLTGNYLLIAGAILFYISDAILAWNRFVRSMNWAKYAVITTYYTAQYLFALSLGADLW